jgi:hypothetical protein
VSAQPESTALGISRHELSDLRAAYRWLASVRPAYVLGPLLLVQWIAVLALALTVRHNGWTYYQGGDQLWYYGGAWLFSHGQVPYPQTGPGWPLLLAPLARFTGPNTAAAFPAVVLFDVLVMLPVALLCMYGIAQRLGGRVFGYWASLVWIAVPYIGIKYSDLGYHQKYTELTLPQSLGLTAMADFPSMVLILVSAYLVVRALDRDDWTIAAVGGLIAGFGAIAIKPSNAIFLAAPVLALAYRGRWRALLVFAAGLVPSIALLVLWKYRGFGYLPAFNPTTLGPTRRVAAPIGDVLTPVHKYVHLNWHQFRENLLSIREHFWSARLIEWLVLAGLLGVLRRSRVFFLFVGVWFGAFAILKGTYAAASVEDASVFRIMMPAFPAFILLLASLPLLVPGLPRRLPAPVDAFRLSPRSGLGLLSAAVVVLGIVPLAAVAAAAPTGPDPKLVVVTGNTPATVDAGLALRARRAGSDVVLKWHRSQPPGSRVIYQILRVPADKAAFDCKPGRSPRCNVNLDVLQTTKTTSARVRPGPGRWTYRVGVIVNWLADPQFGDIYTLSPPVDVVVPKP